MPRWLMMALVVCTACPASAQAQCEALFAGPVAGTRSWNVVEVVTSIDLDAPNSPPEDWRSQDDATPATGTCDTACEARWVGVRDSAIRAFDAYVRGGVACDLLTVSGARIEAVRLEPATAHEAARRAAGTVDSSIGVLPAVLAAPTGAPSPRGFELGMTQVVSAGQPGLSATGAGALAPEARDPFLRHSSLAVSTLLLQPVGTDGDLRDPQLASSEVVLSSTTRRTAYDWFFEVAESAEATETRIEDLQRTALDTLVAEYRAQSVPSDASDAFRLERLLVALRAAGDQFHRRTEDHYYETFVRPELTPDRYELGLSVRVRLSPYLRYLPELPDRFAAALVGNTALRIGNGRADELYGHFTGRLDAALSMWPRTLTSSILRDDPRPSFLLNFAAGGDLVFPAFASGQAGARLSANFLLRYAVDRQDSMGRDDFSMGGSFVLTLPVTESVALAGTYSFRCFMQQDFACISTASFSFAATVADYGSAGT